jgi:coenzyme F420-0:L-glutamate ligase/coenzyme F420-1:gamma-L-glutamate ligase
MDLHQFLRTRRSVRRFKPEPVPDSAIERILTTATHAPSAHNLQPWRFVIVKKSDARTRLGLALTAKMRLDMAAEGAPESEIQTRASSSIRRISEAPVLILLCRDVTEVRADTPEESAMAMQSVASAGSLLLLAAHAEGLGGNWICWPLYAREETGAALELPETWEAAAIFVLGHPINIPEARPRKPLASVVAWR